MVFDREIVPWCLNPSKLLLPPLRCQALVIVALDLATFCADRRGACGVGWGRIGCEAAWDSCFPFSSGCSMRCA